MDNFAPLHDLIKASASNGANDAHSLLQGEARPLVPLTIIIFCKLGYDLLLTTTTTD